MARVRTNEDNPAPKAYRKALRDVIQRCIYGIDLNPDAVELCRLALWIEGHNSGKPLSFLEHKIKCGNSLVGIVNLKALDKGIPDDAFNPLTGDVREVALNYKKVNKQFREKRQFALFQPAPNEHLEQLDFAKEYREINQVEQNNVEEINKVRQKYLALRQKPDWFRDYVAANIYTSAFYYNFTLENDPAAPTSEKLGNHFFNPAASHGQLVGKALAAAEENRFFHYPLEFPDIFADTPSVTGVRAEVGFDIIMGNPPWERIKLQEQEYFATRHADIANAPNKAAREKIIKNLPITHPDLYGEFQKALHTAEANSKFIRGCGRFPLTAVGDINTYSIFAELYLRLLAPNGRAAVIVPTGIATDDNNKAYFGHLITENRLVSLFDFENREAIFQDVHRSYKFCLLTITGKSQSSTYAAQFSFFSTNILHLEDPQRIFPLTEKEMKILNPSTNGVIGFRNKIDKDLTLKIYKQFDFYFLNLKVDLVQGIFHSSNDSYLFKDFSEKDTSPLYEPKMFSHYNHRYSSFDNNSFSEVILNKLENPLFLTNSRYYVPTIIIESKSKNKKRSWAVTYRRIARTTDERTMIACIIPTQAINENGVLLYNLTGKNSALILSNLNCLVLDYLLKQRDCFSVSNNDTKSLAVIPLTQYSKTDILFIIPRVLELTYTAVDLYPFFEELWKEADDELREFIAKQWEANSMDTGRIEIFAKEDTVPFIWHEERRAQLRAELDAYFARLYGLTEQELRYVLDPQSVMGKDFPGETFRVLKDKDIRRYGEYRTQRLILEAWERLENKKDVLLPTEKLLPKPMVEQSPFDGIYRIRNVAEITRLSEGKTRRWFRELYQANYEGLTGDERTDIEQLKVSFYGVIEIVVIGTLRENGFSMAKILKARTQLSQITKKQYPFATNNVRDDLKIAGKSLIFKTKNGDVTLDGTGQYNLEFIKQFFKNIEFDDAGVAQRMFPLGIHVPIVIDPKLSGGHAVIKDKGIYASEIDSYLKGGVSVQSLVKEYDLNEIEIEATRSYYEKYIQQ